MKPLSYSLVFLSFTIFQIAMLLLKLTFVRCLMWLAVDIACAMTFLYIKDCKEN